MLPDRKPLSRMAETRVPYTMRLKPCEIERAKQMALAKGIGHTTISREFFLRGMRMTQLEDLEKGDTRVTA